MIDVAIIQTRFVFNHMIYESTDSVSYEIVSILQSVTKMGFNKHVYEKSNILDIKVQTCTPKGNKPGFTSLYCILPDRKWQERNINTGSLFVSTHMLKGR